MKLKIIDESTTIAEIPVVSCVPNVGEYISLPYPGYTKQSPVKKVVYDYTESTVTIYI